MYSISLWICSFYFSRALIYTFARSNASGLPSSKLRSRVRSAIINMYSLNYYKQLIIYIYQYFQWDLTAFSSGDNSCIFQKVFSKAFFLSFLKLMNSEIRIFENKQKNRKRRDPRYIFPKGLMKAWLNSFRPCFQIKNTSVQMIIWIKKQFILNNFSCLIRYRQNYLAALTHRRPTTITLRVTI